MQRLTLAAALVTVLGLTLAAEPAHPPARQSDADAVHHVLREYVEAWGAADQPRLAEVVDPAGHVYWLGGEGADQQLNSMTFAQILAREPRPQPEYGRTWEVLGVEIVDSHVASARLEISRAGGSYVDILGLHKIAGRWRIVTKTFATR